MWATRAGRHGIQLFVLLLFLGALMIAPLYWPTVTTGDGTKPFLSPYRCAAKKIRVVSHRGVDVDVIGPRPTTSSAIEMLLAQGISSFDLDLFWTLNGNNGDIYVGHPPSLRNIWRLTSDVHLIPFSELDQASQPDGLLRLADLLFVLADHRRALGQVTKHSAADSELLAPPRP